MFLIFIISCTESRLKDSTEQFTFSIKKNVSLPIKFEQEGGWKPKLKTVFH